jgi:serine/threonine-protein kinase
MATEAAPLDWVPGTQFSTYEIESRLAIGGMAEVWRAKMKGAGGFEKRVVIKTMLTSLQHRPELVEMFISEASLAARLSHPNIVDVFDFGQLEGRYYIAMSYVPGLTLRAVHRRLVARGERLPIAAALHIVRDVCEALQHIHELEDGSGPLGMVHRDLSADNIILSTSGTAKLIDFGAARATARTPPNRLFVGRFRYAAPERLRQEGEDCRSDVYSAGIVLFECLTGARAFEGSDAEVIQALATRRGCDPRSKVPTLPTHVAELTKKATAQDPRERFATARDFSTAIANALVLLGASGKEREVTGALSSILEVSSVDGGPKIARADGVPQAVDESHSSTSIALSEREILEASGPIRVSATPTPISTVDTERIDLPLPPEAFPPRNAPTLEEAVRGAAGGAERLADRQPPVRMFPQGRLIQEHAVELFDRGLALRAAERYTEALEVWEQALALAPDNLLYQANVTRLRAQLGELRAPRR